MKKIEMPHAKKITFKGDTLSLNGWAAKVGMKPNTLRRRLQKYGWDLEQALTTPVRSYGKEKK